MIRVTNVIHMTIPLQAKTMNWPHGPDTVRGLMEWPQFNAQHLMTTHENASYCRENFKAIMKHGIELHESYAGSGTGSWTMHRQYKHMLRKDLTSV